MSALEVCALCCAWYLLSSGSNVASAVLLKSLPLPLTATLAQLVAGAVLSSLALRVFRIRRTPRPKRYWQRVLIPLAAGRLSTTALSHLSLWKVPVSYAHTVKATTPLWTVAIARVVCGEKQTGRVLASLGVIASGVALASVTELKFDALGLGAALSAAALLAAQHLYTKRVLKDTGVHPVELLQSISTVALAVLLPFWLWQDSAAAVHGLMSNDGTRIATLLLAEGALAWLQGVTALAVLDRITPLAYGVASAAKRAAVVLVSLLILGNPAPPLNLAGMALAALGVLCYNRAKQKPQRKSSGPLLPI